MASMPIDLNQRVQGRTFYPAHRKCAQWHRRGILARSGIRDHPPGTQRILGLVPEPIAPQVVVLPRGVVHDENAWAIAGHGIAGHAGLFGTAESVARFGAAMLDALASQSDWLEPDPRAYVIPTM